MLLFKLINEEELATCQKKREEEEEEENILNSFLHMYESQTRLKIISLKTKLSKSTTIKDHSTNEDRIMTTDRGTFMDKTTPAYTGNYDVDHNSISKHK